MKATSTKPFSPRQFDFKAEDLHHMRHVKRMGWVRIAREYGCNRTTVIYACRRLGVPLKLELIRPQSLQTPSSPSVPMAHSDSERAA